MIRHSGSYRPDASKVHDLSRRAPKARRTGPSSKRALGGLAEVEGSEEGYMAIGLVGSGDLPGVTLRRAQSVLRWDLRPSLWSHAFVLAGRRKAGGDVGDVRLREVRSTRAPARFQSLPTTRWPMEASSFTTLPRATRTWRS